MDVLDTLLRAPAPTLYAGAAEWWAAHRLATASFTLPIDRAIAGAACVDRLGYAFAGGYAAALRVLVPALPEDTLATFAVTEDAGNHPRAILTTLADGRLNGTKRWVTLGPEGGVILVVARQGVPAEGERPSLRVIQLDARAAGVTITPLPDTPFVPEIPHASLTLANVAVRDADILEGDGYDRYVKPFRTIEDIHVFAALLAHLFVVGRRAKFTEPLLERLLAGVATARALALADPKSSAVHLALAGLLSTARTLITELDGEWSKTDAETKERWQRDRVLIGVANKAREARRAKAWSEPDFTREPRIGGQEPKT